MLTREGRVKILDFGLAKHTPAMPSAGDDTVTVANTQAGVILGTVNYMSPEQARGEIVDFRSDQFSFGLILYELLTGNKAFHRNTVPETLTAILREEPQFAEAAIGTAPPPLRWVIERCLAKDPADRYAATTDLFRDLRTLRDHLSEAWTQETSKAAAPANMRQRRRVKTAAALAGAAIVGFAIGWLALPAGNRGVAQ